VCLVAGDPATRQFWITFDVVNVRPRSLVAALHGRDLSGDSVKLTTSRNESKRVTLRVRGGILGCTVEGT